ncbi:tripartite tricarboxylate transporter substrate-binding protein [Cupriavidus sp. NPDC089707]|uniref:tripartite tricarboxylate transporter substrate-binding protein n=1 Tax=Cupriavidus sp. NPDC089707 TaxID=3363963 RepID=UPI00381718F9
MPTVAESGTSGFDIDGWIGLYGPARLPPKLVDTLAEAVDGILRKPSTVEAVGKLSGTVYPGGPKELKAFQAREFERAQQIVRTASIPIE